MSLQDLLRQLPAIDAILGTSAGQGLVARFGRRAAIGAARRATEGARAALRASSGGAAAAAGRAPVPNADALAELAARQLDAAEAGRLVDVINATGVLVHTNLGRAPLGPAAIARLAARAAGQTNLEMDLETGRRGRRAEGCEDLLVDVSGAEAAFVVNNTAAALLLALNTFASGKGVLVSRGELVEIGGSFRLPDICERSGARLIEVGTTNRTRAADFKEALDAAPGDVGLILKMHPSNFRIVGFTEEASLEQLVALGRERSIPVVMDQGSGALEDLSAWGVVGEPPLPDLVAQGADLVLFSGDKLLGGPQAGCAVGRRLAVDACRKNPLYRALRVGRLVASALESTLWAHATGRLDDIPVMAQLRLDAAVVGERARRMAAAIASGLAGRVGLSVDVVEDASTSGGGSSPSSRIPTFVLRLSGPSLDVERVSARLRSSRPALIGRIAEDRLILDARTIPPERDDEVARLLVAAAQATTT